MSENAVERRRRLARDRQRRKRERDAEAAAMRLAAASKKPRPDRDELLRILGARARDGHVPSMRLLLEELRRDEPRKTTAELH
jgi:hypothetical protein